MYENTEKLEKIGKKERKVIDNLVDNLNDMTKSTKKNTIDGINDIGKSARNKKGEHYLKDGKSTINAKVIDSDIKVNLGKYIEKQVFKVDVE